MEKIEKTTYLTALFDLYNGLLTEKQVNYFKHYYFNDETFQEIGDLYNVSRNAVYDQLSKVSESLIKYETILGLHSKQTKRLELWQEYDKSGNLEVLTQIRKVDENDGK